MPVTWYTSACPTAELPQLTSYTQNKIVGNSELATGTFIYMYIIYLIMFKTSYPVHPGTLWKEDKAIKKYGHKKENFLNVLYLIKTWHMEAEISSTDEACC